VFWAASILVAVPVLLHKQSARIPGSHTEILSGAAAVGSMFAELFMIQSLLVFDPAVQLTAGEQPSSPTYNRRAVSCLFQPPWPHCLESQTLFTWHMNEKAPYSFDRSEE